MAVAESKRGGTHAEGHGRKDTKKNGYGNVEKNTEASCCNMTSTRAIQTAVKLAACGACELFSSTCEITLPIHKTVLSASSSEMEVSFPGKVNIKYL
jgi:hypothetical protein